MCLTSDRERLATLEAKVDLLLKAALVQVTLAGSALVGVLLK